jgi:hypothetical protein
LVIIITFCDFINIFMWQIFVILFTFGYICINKQPTTAYKLGEQWRVLMTNIIINKQTRNSNGREFQLEGTHQSNGSRRVARGKQDRLCALGSWHNDLSSEA